jgi:hypothetical protein
MDALEFVFKRAGGLELKLDVYLPFDASIEETSPVCIWWHGGGRGFFPSSDDEKLTM